jgi:hypothetical protein
MKKNEGKVGKWRRTNEQEKDYSENEIGYTTEKRKSWEIVWKARGGILKRKGPGSWGQIFSVP